jgi:hypothetical protein
MHNMKPDRYEAVALDVMREWVRFAGPIDPVKYACRVALCAVDQECRRAERRVSVGMIGRVICARLLR